MVTQVRLELSAQQPLSSAHGYPLYRCLVNKAGEKYREFLRRPGLKPVSQFLLPNPDDARGGVQVVNLLTEDAHNHLLPVLLRMTDYPLPGFEETVQVVSVSVQRISEFELTGRFFTGGVPAFGAGLTFLTPAAYRVGNGYALFPSPELILRDAAVRFNTLGLRVKAEQPVVERLARAARVDGYKLQSASYPLGGREIPGFFGRLVLSADLPEQHLRMFHMLLHSLRYTGAGVKPSLGMGAADVKEV